MTTLAFDTCFGACSAALRWRRPDGEWLLREDYREMPTGHAETLLPMIEQLMTDSGVEFKQLTRLAVTAGPGSFTGVRIGLSAARGFRLALGLPVVALTSLAVIAARAEALLASGGPFKIERAGAALVACVDARGGNVYAEAFGASLAEWLTPPALWTPQSLARALRGRRIIAVGSGGALLAAAVAAEGGEATAVLPALQPHARHLALLAEAAPFAVSLDPLYLRETDAKPMALALQP